MDPSITSINNTLGYLKLISGEETILIGPTDGKSAIAEAKDVFTSYIDYHFLSYGSDIKSKPSGPTNIEVYELVRDGNFYQIFTGARSNLDSLCLEQSQIIEFARHQRKWLRTDGDATFFLYKVRGEYFVASVFFDGYSRLRVSAHKLGFGHIWCAGFRHRVVVPQLTLAN